MSYLYLENIADREPYFSSKSAIFFNFQSPY